MNEAHLYFLEAAALRLAPLLDDIVFVGGATLCLLITDSGAAPPRATIDIDVIAKISTYDEYNDFSKRLRRLGFSEDAREGASICRWLHGDLVIDVMPLIKEVLGFSNRWYPGAFKSAQTIILSGGQSIRSISAPYFLATKVEAFRGRGSRDYYASRDLEDVVAVIDGRQSILEEIAAAPVDLRMYLAEAAKELLVVPRFHDALPGYLLPDEISQQRLASILRRFQSITDLRN
ncbi:MAG TPA: hypothetical protein VHZ52_16850 [Acidobacteriaceae bacterium]|jgi:hypothetical protein|nr:hypothetical protein [Acidobacteriaceae bacterium]